MTNIKENAKQSHEATENNKQIASSLAMTHARVPKLRFKEFEGEWEEILLDDFAIRGSGHTPSKSHIEYYNGNINWISLSDSKRLDNGYIDETNTKITELGIKKSSAVLHPKGTVLLSRDAGVGKSAVMKHAMAVSQHFIVWKTKANKSSNWFLYNWLQIMKPQFERIAIGNTIKTIGLPYFKKLKIVCPAFEEQQKIANFLTAVDTKLQQLTTKKETLAQYKKGVMQQLFSQQLRFKPDNTNEIVIARTQDDAISPNETEFPDWEEKRLGEVGKIITGSTPSTSIQDYYDGEKLFVSPADIQGNRYVSETKTTLTELGFNKGRKVKKNSVLFVCIGSTIGKVAQASEECLTNQQLNVIEANKDNSNDFIYSLLNFKGAKIKLLAGVQAVPQINKTDFSNLKFNFPSLKEQQKIATYLSSIDKKIEAVQTQITQTQAFKKGLLQQMFV